MDSLKDLFKAIEKESNKMAEGAIEEFLFEIKRNKDERNKDEGNNEDSISHDDQS